jgi:iron complex outermembrane receptor protein
MVRLKLLQLNSEYKLSETDMYFNAALLIRKFFANYRTPYWRTWIYAQIFPWNNNAGGYDGYVPTFETKDYNATIGFKSVLNDWNIDASLLLVETHKHIK